MTLADTSHALAEMSRFRTWEGAAARRMAGCRTPSDIVDCLRNRDANVRIVAVRILGASGAALGGDRQMIIQALTDLLFDDACNAYCYDAFQCEDDEQPVRVSDTARAALNQLDVDETRDAIGKRISARYR